MIARRVNVTADLAAGHQARGKRPPGSGATMRLRSHRAGRHRSAQATLASLLRKRLGAIRLNDHIEADGLYYQTPTIRPPPHARKIIHPTVASKPTAITNFVPNRTAALRAAVPDELPVRSTPLITRPRARLDYGKAGIALHPS
jgi:hypothetical protein